jgi:hypothetical protein
VYVANGNFNMSMGRYILKIIKPFSKLKKAAHDLQGQKNLKAGLDGVFYLAT